MLSTCCVLSFLHAPLLLPAVQMVSVFHKIKYHMVRLVTWTNQITEFGWWKAKEWEIGKRSRERPTIFTFSQDLGYTNFYQFLSIKCPKNATRSVSLTFLSEVRKVGWWILSFLCSVRKMSYHKITSNALALTKAGLVDVVWLCLYKLTEVFIFI